MVTQKFTVLFDIYFLLTDSGSHPGNPPTQHGRWATVK